MRKSPIAGVFLVAVLSIAPFALSQIQNVPTLKLAESNGESFLKKLGLFPESGLQCAIDFTTCSAKRVCTYPYL